MHFLPIRQTISIGVGVVRIGSHLKFFKIGQAVVVPIQILFGIGI